MYQKHTPSCKGHWKATQVWLMLSFAFLYPYETFFEWFQNGWRNLSEQLMAWGTLLKQAKTVAYVHTASISAYFQCDLPPAIFSSRPKTEALLEQVLPNGEHHDGWGLLDVFRGWMEAIQAFSPLFYTKFGTTWFNWYGGAQPNVGLDDFGGYFQP